MDRISNLPDEIIFHIGSFLSAKEAACAMVLSRRWRNLFTIVPELSSDYMNTKMRKDFSDQVFALPLNSRIRKLSIAFEFHYIDPTPITRCLPHALNHGVVDLELDVTIEDLEQEDRYSPPLEVFTCETLVKLDLAFSQIDLLHGNANLPSLKILILQYIRFDEFDTLDTLLSACPVLEELDILDLREWKWSRVVSSPSIKRLTIHNDFEDEYYYDESEYESISFDTPSLTYLEYSDFGRKEYPIVNLNSLVEAQFDIYKEEDILSDPVNLFHGLKNVEILSVSDETLELMHDFREAVPMFENLSRLTLVNKDKCCWFGLRVLLEKSPKLKTFAIEGYLHSDEVHHFEPLCECLLGYSFLLNCRIEVLKITEFKGRSGEMSQLKQILEKLPYLKVFEIHIVAVDEDKKMKVKKDLLRIPRASSKCKIKVATTYAKVYDDEELDEKAASGRCEAIVPKKGLRCKRSAAKGSVWCWQHN